MDTIRSTHGSSAVYLPGLNGIRAIASIAVVVSHATLSLPMFNLKGGFFGVAHNGAPGAYALAANGVTMFFVLSGFLITYLLKLESEKQSINIKKFYIRRILRIWPIYYLFLFLLILTMCILKEKLNLKPLVFYLLFAANIPMALNFPIASAQHLWSIGVEEQFYLFWPWFIKKCKGNLVRVIIILIVVQILFRGIVWIKSPYSGVAFLSVVNRFDCMMIGAVGALLYLQKNPLFLRMIDNKVTQLAAFSILILLAINKFHFNALIDTLAVSIMTLVLIIGQINIKNRIVSFDMKMLKYLGKISYGVYVYHPLVILLLSLIMARLPLFGITRYVAVYVSVMAFTIIVAHISYEYFEKVFLTMKGKFSIVRSTNDRLYKEEQSFGAKGYDLQGKCCGYLLKK